MKTFLTSNSWEYRLLRTVVQGIIGVLIANLDALIAPLTISDSFKPIIVALCMAILSPIMAEIGRASEKAETEDVIVPYEPDVKGDFDGEDSTRNKE